MKSLSFFVLFCATIATAQQEAQFTSYENNLPLFNSGVTGLKHKVSAAANARMQWENIDGGPKSITTTIDVALDKIKGAIGIAYLYDQIGSQTLNRAYLNYAYHLKQENYKLGLGLGVNMGQARQKLNFIAGNPTDPTIAAIPGTTFTVNLNPGVYFLNNSFEIGIGVSQIGLVKPPLNNPYGMPHFYLNGAYKILLSADTDLRIRSLVKSDLGATTAEIQGIAKINNTCTVGLGIRNTKAFCIIASLIIADHFNIGYLYEYFKRGSQPSFEVATGRIVDPVWHTHEIFISYRLPYH